MQHEYIESFTHHTSLYTIHIIFNAQTNAIPSK
jgi:hypothetical protein